MKQESSIKSFTDLTAWQEGHKLVLLTYNCTKEFPSKENYGLKPQMQRAAVSVTSNIAEGFARNSFADKKHFYVMAQGSLTELQNQALISRDLGYISPDVSKKFANQAVVVHKLLSGLIKSTNARKVIA